VGSVCGSLVVPYDFLVMGDCWKFRKACLGTVLVGLIFFLAAGSLSANDNIKKSVSTVIELAEELKNDGKDLCIVRMPVRSEIYQNQTDAHDNPLEESHENTLAGDDAERLLKEAGIAVLNLYPDIRGASLQSEIFHSDRFHFTPEADKSLAEIVAKKLRDAGVMMLPDEKKNVVFMGECFAESFAKEIIHTGPKDEIKILNKNGGGSLVHNYLYVFPEEYLKDTDLVVWIFTDRHFSNPNFATLEPDPGVPTSSEPRMVLARAKAVTAMALGAGKKLNYPDALRTGIFELAESGEQVIGIDQILKARQVTLNRKYREGDLLRLKIVPWDAWIRKHPKLVSMYLIDNIEDFTMPRFWIEDWLIEDE
jgi:hypothetical protein